VHQVKTSTQLCSYQMGTLIELQILTVALHFIWKYALNLNITCMQVRPPQPKHSKVKVKPTRSTGEMSNESDSKENDRNKQLVTGPVVIYDIFCILPVSRQLAQDYV